VKPDGRVPEGGARARSDRYPSANLGKGPMFVTSAHNAQFLVSNTLDRTGGRGITWVVDRMARSRD